jgi:hypothetical protein
MKNLFKYLIATSIILTVIYWLLPYIEPYWLSPEDMQLIYADGYKSYIPLQGWIGWVMFVIWIALSLGLFLFKKVARKGFLIFLIITSGVTFFWGFLVQTPVSAGIGNLLSITDGAILVMAYLTSVSDEFN